MENGIVRVALFSPMHRKITDEIEKQLIEFDTCWVRTKIYFNINEDGYIFSLKRCETQTNSGCPIELSSHPVLNLSCVDNFIVIEFDEQVNWDLYDFHSIFSKKIN